MEAETEKCPEVHGPVNLTDTVEKQGQVSNKTPDTNWGPSVSSEVLCAVHAPTFPYMNAHNLLVRKT